MSAATLNGSRAISAAVSIPAWGAWYADVVLDAEASFTGAVTLQVADLTLRGTVLSGGPSKGRSMFRIVAGGGGWGKGIAARSYANDAGVKVSTVLGDAALEVGETIAFTGSDRVGPAFVRAAGPASRALEQIAPSGWYVDEGGTTRLGRRTHGALPAGVTHGPVDLARGTVTLASDSIAAILPGITVDGLVAVDVLHTIDAKGGLRSEVWGARGTTGSRRVDALKILGEQLDPDRRFRGVTEYRVVTREGKRVNLQPVRVSTGMPDLRRVLARPGTPGTYGEAALGSRILVGFADSDPARPYVAAYEDIEGEGFLPATLDLLAGTSAGGEHVATVEGVALLLYNFHVALMAAAGGGPLVAAVLQPLLGTALNVALAAQAVPAPSGIVGQNIASTAQLPGFATGTVPATTVAFFEAAIAALATKTANASGHFPSLGAANVRTG